MTKKKKKVKQNPKHKELSRLSYSHEKKKKQSKQSFGEAHPQIKTPASQLRRKHDRLPRSKLERATNSIISKVICNNRKRNPFFPCAISKARSPKKKSERHNIPVMFLMFGNHHRIFDPVCQGIKSFDKGKKRKAFSKAFRKKFGYITRRRSRVRKYTCSFKSRRVKEVAYAR